MTRDLLRTALDAADAAADVHRRFSGRRHAIQAMEKGQSDFVSEVDLAAQEAALALIRARHPSHHVLAEEDERGAARAAPTPSGRPGGVDGNDTPGGDAVATWIVDPLDGTTNFLHGHPMFASSVAVAIGGRVMAGAVVASDLGERWWAARGEGAFLNDRAIRVSEERGLRGALIGTGFPFKNLPLLPAYLVQMDRVLRSTSGIRRLGSAALDLCYVAAGRLDAFWELSLGAWDVAAGIVIVQEAGGVVTTLDGGEVDPLSSGGYLAANSRELHAALADLVRRPDAEESSGA